MRKTISDTATIDLHDRIVAIEGIEIRDHKALNELIRSICEWFEAQHTFSDWMQSNEGQWHKHCPTCDRRYVARPLAFPKLMMRYLHLLVYYGKPMSVKEIERQSGIARQFDESSHFPLLRHWNLIERCENSRYRPTAKAKNVLLMEDQVERHIWVFNNERLETPPPEEKDGELALINQINHKEYNDDEIFDASVSAFALL